MLCGDYRVVKTIEDNGIIYYPSALKVMTSKYVEKIIYDNY